jgi:hypothetical protein
LDELRHRSEGRDSRLHPAKIRKYGHVLLLVSSRESPLHNAPPCCSAIEEGQRPAPRLTCASLLMIAGVDQRRRARTAFNAPLRRCYSKLARGNYVSSTQLRGSTTSHIHNFVERQQSRTTTSESSLAVPDVVG